MQHPRPTETLPLMGAGALLAQTTAGDNSLIFVLLALLLLIILLFWWGSTRPGLEEEEAGEEMEHEPPVGPVTVEEGAAAEMAEEVAEAPQAMAEEMGEAAVEEPPPKAEPAVVASAAADDLKRIEGIGPKIEGILQAAGINSFAELADTDAARLNKIVVEDAGIRVAATESWPEQAMLAAEGDWESLEELQERLKGGRYQ